MAVSLDACGGLILAGGRSRRMGRCKALLPVGDATMLERIGRQMEVLPECWLSTNDPALAAAFSGEAVADVFVGKGPLAGIHAALLRTSRPYLFCVACDMPYFSGRIIGPMAEAFPDGADALVCQDSTGRIHPLCGIYAKSALPAITRCLQSGQLRARDLLEQLRCAYFQTAGQFSDQILWNINTPEAYNSLREEEAFS